MAGFWDTLEGTPEVGTGPKPPQNDAELAERMNGWREIHQRIRNDPAMQQALIMFGAQMVQPMNQADTGIGQFGRAAALGTNTYHLLRGDLSDQAQKAEREKVELERTRAQTESSRASAEASRGQERRSEALHPGQVQKQGLEVDTAKNALEVAKFELKNLQAQDAAGLLTPEKKLEMWELDKKIKVAEANMRNAQAESASATAKKTGIEATQAQVDAAREQELRRLFEDRARQGMGDPNVPFSVVTPAEDRAARIKGAEDYANYAKGPGTAQQKVSATLGLLAQAFPNKTPDQLAQYAIQLERQPTIEAAIKTLGAQMNFAFEPAERDKIRAHMNILLRQAGINIDEEPAKPTDTSDAAAKPAAPKVEHFDNQGNRIGGAAPGGAPAAPAAPVPSQSSSGPSESDFAVMLQDAQRGGTTGLTTLRKWSDENALTLGQRKRAAAVLNGR